MFRQMHAVLFSDAPFQYTHRHKNYYDIWVLINKKGDKNHLVTWFLMGYTHLINMYKKQETQNFVLQRYLKSFNFWKLKKRKKRKQQTWG